MKVAYLGLGSNLGDREQNLQNAINHLHAPDLRIRRMSPVYETAPRDLLDQPSFLNMILEVETDLLPMRLLGRIESIQREMGRKRVVPKGPRNIDIDILLHGSASVDTQQLVIPHPRMAERRFVLEPLAELVPDLRPPQFRPQSIKDLLAATAGQKVKRIEWTPTLPE